MDETIKLYLLILLCALSCYGSHVLDTGLKCLFVIKDGVSCFCTLRDPDFVVQMLWVGGVCCSQVRWIWIIKVISCHLHWRLPCIPVGAGWIRVSHTLLPALYCQGCVSRWNMANLSDVPEIRANVCCSGGVQCRTAKLLFKFPLGWVPHPTGATFH